MQLIEIAIVGLLYTGMPFTNAVEVTFDLDSSAYFSTGDLILTCRVDQDVLINSATFKRDQVTQITIFDPTSTCTPTKFLPADLHNYSASCVGLRNFTLTKYGVNKTEEEGRVWQCTFISNPGGPCISTSPCVSPNITVPVGKTFYKDFICNTCKIERKWKEIFETTTTSTTASTTTPDTTCNPDGFLFIFIDICIIISYSIMIILIIDLIKKRRKKGSIFMACTKNDICHRFCCILPCMIVFASGLFIIIFTILGHQCQNILVVGLVLGSIIIVVTIIYLIVFIKTVGKGMQMKNVRPRPIHIETIHKVESTTPSVKTSDRPHKLKPRPEPPAPENIDAKNQNLQGLSVTFDDTQGLASGTPQPIRLPPLTLAQETVQEENASEEKTKKKRKKKKKKGQMNEGNPEVEMIELKNIRT